MIYKNPMELLKLYGKDHFCLVELPYLLLNYCLTYVFLKYKVKER